MGDKLKSIVIGVGYLGALHAQKYTMLPDVELVAVVDVNEARAREVGEKLNVAYATDYKPLLEQVDMASIVVPTFDHFRIAVDCLKGGVHALIEKPLTRTLDQALSLVEYAKSVDLVVQVGHLERFNPAIQKMREEISEPIVFEADRIAPFKPRGIDVDVVSDLMIHDIDILLSMTNEAPIDIKARGEKVLTPYYDIALAWLQFPNGCMASLKASRLGRESVRELRVYGNDKYASLDTESKRVRIVPFPSPDEQKQIQDLAQLFHGTMHEFELGDPLLEEIESFVAAVKYDFEPLVSLQAGADAIAVCAEIINRIEEFWALQRASSRLRESRLEHSNVQPKTSI